MTLAEQQNQTMSRLWNIFVPELLKCSTFEEQIALIGYSQTVGDAFRKYHQLLYLKCIRSKQFMEDFQDYRKDQWVKCNLGLFPDDDPQPSLLQNTEMVA